MQNPDCLPQLFHTIPPLTVCLFVALAIAGCRTICSPFSGQLLGPPDWQIQAVITIS